MIYLDNAATTLHKPPQVGQAVLDALANFGNSARGSHGGSLAASHTIYDTRVKIARLFHCSRADHVVFTANVTEALNLALYGLLRAGDHAVATVLDHNSVLRPLYRLEDQGRIHLDLVPADRLGRLDMDALARLVRPGTRVVVCPHASNLTGNLVDLAAVGRAAHAAGALFIVDAAQTAGVFPIDMEALGIDVLCFTGHKGLMGPQGTGGLCLREGLVPEPLKVGGTGVQTYRRSQPLQLPAALEAGTLNGHGLAGLSAALDFIEQIGLDRIREKETALMARFYRGVLQIPGITVYGDFSGARAAIVALNLRDYDSGAVADALEETYGIAVRAGAHCAPRMHEALGTREQGAVRFSFSWFNTETEIDEALRALGALAADPS